MRQYSGDVAPRQKLLLETYEIGWNTAKSE